MILLISPAKTLDFETPAPTKLKSSGDFIEDSKKLIAEIKKLDAAQLGKMMKISDKLAALNVNRFQTWPAPFTSENAKQALFAFKGDV